MNKKVKVDKLKKILHKNKTEFKAKPKAKSNSKQTFSDKLSGSQFRWLNELLYTTDGSSALQVFQNKPNLFRLYHEGFRSQASQWPINPVDVIYAQLKTLPACSVVADMGCGDAQLAKELQRHNKKIKVHSFDLCNEHNSSLVTVCDIAHTPLANGACQVVVFSLSLMGTNWADFIVEAHRILVNKGMLYIAEVVSRISDKKQFISFIEKLGFKLLQAVELSKMFINFKFEKVFIASRTDVQLKNNLLKPCNYKKR